MNIFNFKKSFTKKVYWPGLLLGLLLGISANSSHATLSQSPLFLTISVDPNILFNMSIETPMGGAAYNDQPDGASCGGRVNDGGTVGICYDKGKTYLGYFDSNKCYAYNTSGGFFAPRNNVLNTDHECSGQFSGNFMNWATMTAMDMFVWTMTGGNRIVDNADDKTIIRRTRKQNNDNWFPHKLLKNGHNVRPSTVTPWSDTKIYIENTDFGVKFGTSRGGSQKATYNVNVRLCNQNKTLENNCVAYDNGTYYKPEGLIQKNSDHMRFAVTSFTNTNGNGIDGGVLRSNMKYIGSLMPDSSGNDIANPNKEIKTDGTIEVNPNPADASASSVSKSGVIPYLNKFSDVSYKGNDPASELFYESIRYFKNLGPTPEYLGGANGGFPILDGSRWQDPITQWCQKNFIIGINDANPWKDKKLPGTFFTTSSFHGNGISDDFGQPSNPDTDINVTALTNKVGDLEGLTGTSQCIGCTAANCNGNATFKTITGLGEVFGTCPYAPKENSYYIAGLAYYANTQDIRTGSQGTVDFPNKQTINTFMVDTQEYGTNPLVGQMNMLWLAGKYGGFNDIDGDAEPDNSVFANGIQTHVSEWDENADGEPDNYVLASNPDKLVTALNKAFTDINKQISSASAVAANSTQLNTNTQVYQAKFNSADWSGNVQAFNVDVSSGTLVPSWETAALLPVHGSRNIYTYDPTATAGSRGVPFLWTNLTTTPAGSSQQDYLNTLNGINDGQGESRLNWLRGDQSKEISNSGGIFRNRATPLGDIINSDPLYVGDTDYGYASLAGAEGSSYTAFLSATALRTPMLYLGANDGMLHGFDARANLGGAELLAYVPNVLYSELSKLTEVSYAHQYYVDGPLGVSDAYKGTDWYTLLAGTTGAGARAVFALDVTNPTSFSASSAMWEFTSDNDVDLGYTLVQPVIARTDDGHWVVIVANGYDSDNGHAVLFVLDAFTGAVLQKIDTGVGTVADKNGLSSPIAVDTDNDRSVDTVYAGDLYGNLWRFDISGAAGSWPVPVSPLFAACAASGLSCSSTDRQPITAKPNVGKVGGSGSDQNGVGTMVYFGTGKYQDTGDNIVGVSPQIQSFYGLWDQGSNIVDRADLQPQTIDFEGFPFTSDGVTKTTKEVRVVSKNPVCYAVTSVGCTASSPLKKGWVMNLLSPNNGAEGERSISFPLVRRGLVIFSTAIPGSDPCLAGGTSWLMELDALAGGVSSSAAFDVNNDGVVDSDDYVIIDVNGVGVKVLASGLDQGIGITKNPAVIEGSVVDFKYSSGSTGQMGTVTDAGAGGGSGTRRSWRQLQ